MTIAEWNRNAAPIRLHQEQDDLARQWRDALRRANDMYSDDDLAAERTAKALRNSLKRDLRQVRDAARSVGITLFPLCGLCMFRVTEVYLMGEERDGLTALMVGPCAHAVYLLDSADVGAWQAADRDRIRRTADPGGTLDHGERQWQAMSRFVELLQQAERKGPVAWDDRYAKTRRLPVPSNAVMVSIPADHIAELTGELARTSSPGAGRD